MSNLFLLGIYLLKKQGFQYMTAQLMQMEKMLKLSSATRSISVDAVELGDNK